MRNPAVVGCEVGRVTLLLYVWWARLYTVLYVCANSTSGTAVDACVHVNVHIISLQQYLTAF